MAKRKGKGKKERRESVKDSGKVSFWHKIYRFFSPKISRTDIHTTLQKRETLKKLKSNAPPRTSPNFQKWVHHHQKYVLLGTMRSMRAKKNKRKCDILPGVEWIRVRPLREYDLPKNMKEGHPIGSSTSLNDFSGGEKINKMRRSLRRKWRGKKRLMGCTNRFRYHARNIIRIGDDAYKVIKGEAPPEILKKGVKPKEQYLHNSDDMEETDKEGEEIFGFEGQTPMEEEDELESSSSDEEHHHLQVMRVKKKFFTTITPNDDSANRWKRKLKRPFKPNKYLLRVIRRLRWLFCFLALFARITFAIKYSRTKELCKVRASWLSLRFFYTLFSLIPILYFQMSLAINYIVFILFKDYWEPNKHITGNGTEKVKVSTDPFIREVMRIHKSEVFLIWTTLTYALVLTGIVLVWRKEFAFYVREWLIILKKTRYPCTALIKTYVMLHLAWTGVAILFLIIIIALQGRFLPSVYGSCVATALLTSQFFLPETLELQPDSTSSLDHWAWFGLVIYALGIIGSRMGFLFYHVFVEIFHNAVIMANERTRTVLRNEKFMEKKNRKNLKRLKFKHLFTDYNHLLSIGNQTAYLFALPNIIFCVLQFVIIVLILVEFYLYEEEENAPRFPGTPIMVRYSRGETFIALGIYFLINFALIFYYFVQASRPQEEAVKGIHFIRKQGFMDLKSEIAINYNRSMLMNFELRNPVDLSPGFYTLNREIILPYIFSAILFFSVIIQFQEKIIEHFDRKNANISRTHYVS